jgi:hypothetical protein
VVEGDDWAGVRDDPQLDRSSTPDEGGSVDSTGVGRQNALLY